MRQPPVTGGTDTPLMLLDLRRRGLTGATVSESLERAGLTCNKNGVPGDTQPPTVTSGIRFGVSAGTTRGFGVREFEKIGQLIADVLDRQTGTEKGRIKAEQDVRGEVRKLTEQFPIYAHEK